MAKIPLSIDKNYCSDWGVWQGIRELIQNAKDADDDGYAMSIDHYPRTARLEIVSRGVYVDPAKLLVLGRSDKAPGQKRGQFGEGFVLGCLALMRKGCDVSFRNGDLSWTISFEEPEPPHPLAGNELMTFKSRQLVAREQDFRVEIENMPTDVWDVLKKLFLFITPPASADTFAVQGGTLLLHPDYVGRVHARGIFVGNFKDISCGYDLEHLQLDRDRRFVDEYTLHYKLAQMWKDAIDKHPDVAAPRVYDMAKANAREARSLVYHADDKILRSVRERFQGEHGDNAVPVGTMAEAKELEELGGKPAMVNDVLKELLEKGGLTIEGARKDLEGMIDARFVPGDLDSDELRTFLRLCTVVPEFLLVQFHGDKPACRLVDGDAKVGLDRRLLKKSFKQTLKLLVGTEARRRKVDPVDVLLERITIDHSRTTGGHCDECSAVVVPDGQHFSTCSMYLGEDVAAQAS